MLIFGHAGIALGAAAVAARVVRRHQAGAPLKEPFFAPLAGWLDIRLLVVGSLLPDIIDKPIGQYFFNDFFNNGRIFAHTLLFFVLVAAAGYLLYKSRRQIWLITLAAGVFMHLALDDMWQVPGTFFWPLMGWRFAGYELTGWFSSLLKALLSEPYIYISEAVGLAVVIWFAAGLFSQKKVLAFIRRGKVD